MPGILLLNLRQSWGGEANILISPPPHCKLQRLQVLALMDSLNKASVLPKSCINLDVSFIGSWKGRKLDEALKEELASFPGKYQLPEKASESLWSL